MNLLIVDDDELTCQWLRKNILEMNFPALKQVEYALSAEDALRLISSKYYHILLTDIKMVEMNGLELISHAKQLYPAISTLILTAYASFDYAQKAVELGVKGFLLKPLDASELQKQLSGIIQDAFLQEQEAEPPLSENFLRWTINYVQEHLDQEINMAFIANHLDFSYSHFSREFKQKMGRSFAEYVLDVKMQRATEILKQGYRTGACAEQLGYGTPQNFNRAFKRFYKCTPSEYRKRHSR